MKRLFVDTSAWFAYANRSDRDHRRVRDAMNGFVGRLVTTNFVFDETVTLVAGRYGHEAATRIGEALIGAKGIDLTRVTANDERAAWQLFVERPDKGYSFTDCTSFTVARRLEITEVAALDDDFRREGFTVVV